MLRLSNARMHCIGAALEQYIFGIVMKMLNRVLFIRRVL